MCAYYVYDDDYDGYICEVNLDEDELSRYLQSPENSKLLGGFLYDIFY